MNLESERRQMERQEVRQVMLHHLQQTCVNWDDDMDDFMPPKPWPPTHDVPPLYMNVDLEKRKRERQEVRRAILHQLQHHHLSTGMTT